MMMGFIWGIGLGLGVSFSALVVGGIYVIGRALRTRFARD